MTSTAKMAVIKMKPVLDYKDGVGVDTVTRSIAASLRAKSGRTKVPETRITMFLTMTKISPRPSFAATNVASMAFHQELFIAVKTVSGKIGSQSIVNFTKLGEENFVETA